MIPLNREEIEKGRKRTFLLLNRRYLYNISASHISSLKIVNMTIINDPWSLHKFVDLFSNYSSIGKILELLLIDFHLVKYQGFFF